MAAARQLSKEPARAAALPWRASLRRLLGPAGILVPSALLAVIVLAAIFAPYIVHVSPIEETLTQRLLPPAWAKGGLASHPLGTDIFGRDVFSRLVYGARTSLIVGALAVVVAGVLGTGSGLAAGFLGGVVDTVLMGIVDVFLGVPIIVVAIMLATVKGPSFTNVIVVIAVLMWPQYARQARGETLSVRERDYVLLARISGCSRWRIALVHILPNIAPSLLVLGSIQFGTAIIFAATLSFLGVGIPPPTPAWGSMISAGKALVATNWWLSFFPGLAITLTVVSVNLISDWLRDHLDPSVGR